MKKKITGILILFILFSGNYGFLQAQQGKVSSLPDRDKAIRLAYRYLHGVRVSLDYKKAYRIFYKLVETGDAEACNALGMMYRLGLGVEQDEEKAARLFREAYDRGYAKGAYNLAMAYKYGHGVPQDFDLAFEWLVFASMAGYEWTDYAIGYCWYKGQGVIKQRYDMAVYCFRKGAEKGDAACMYHLGYCYFKGHGVERDPVLGRQWMEKAAEKGLAKAVDFMASKENLETFGEETVRLRSAAADPVYEVLPEQYPETFRHEVLTPVEGEWEGKIIIYDWSGEKIEKEIPLAASFRMEGETLKGAWIQNDTVCTELNIRMGDSGWDFNKMLLDVQRPTIIQEGHFRSTHTAGGTYLTGTLTCYSEVTREYTEPAFVALRNVSEGISSGFTEAGSGDCRVFPNPFHDRLTVLFTLEEAQKVSIDVFDMSGKRMYSDRNISCLAGPNEVEIPLWSVPGGNYLLRVHGENIRKTVYVVKE